MPDLEMDKARVARAWTMYERAVQREDKRGAALWMAEWQRLANRVIAETVLDNKEWMT